jgi:hypothetical protein
MGFPTDLMAKSPSHWLIYQVVMVLKQKDENGLGPHLRLRPYGHQTACVGTSRGGVGRWSCWRHFSHVLILY